MKYLLLVINNILITLISIILIYVLLYRNKKDISLDPLFIYPKVNNKLNKFDSLFIYQKAKIIKNKFELMTCPKIMSINDYKLTTIPNDIIEFITRDNYELSEHKLSGLKAFLMAKALFIKMFKNTKNDIDSFIETYKKYLQLEDKNGYNFCIKLYNNLKIYKINKQKYTPKYIYISNETIIKIKNKKIFMYIENELSNKKIFLVKKEDNIILSYGSIINVKNDNTKIDIYFNNLFDKKYNNIKIMYWTSVKIN
jgi:hypothetical protein